MRVMHFITQSPDGRYFRDLVPALSASGVDVLVGTLGTSQRPSYMLDKPDGFHSLAADRRLEYPLAVCRLARILRRARVDILQTHLTDATLVGVAASRLAGVPLVITRHHMDEVALLGSKLVVRIDKLLPKAAARVVVFSEAVRQYMVDNDGVAREHIDLIYQGFDFDPMTPKPADVEAIRAELSMNEHFSIGCVGRLFPTKGHQYLVEAVADLSNHIPNVRLFVAGSGDPELVLSPARRLGIEDRIVLVGFRSDVSAFMRAVDVVVHASLTEAFCQTIIEALAAGAPLVVTDVAGAPEVVQDGMNGLLVRPRDSVGLVTAIRSLHESPLTRAALAGKAAQSVRDRFTIDQMIAGQLATYERVLYRAA